MWPSWATDLRAKGMALPKSLSFLSPASALASDVDPQALDEKTRKDARAFVRLLAHKIKPYNRAKRWLRRLTISPKQSSKYWRIMMWPLGATDFPGKS
jgi:hypothetical protein